MHYYVSVHLMGINVRIVKLVVQEYSYLWMSLFMNGSGFAVVIRDVGSSRKTAISGMIMDSNEHKS